MEIYQFGTAPKAKAAGYEMVTPKTSLVGVFTQPRPEAAIALQLRL